MTHARFIYRKDKRAGAVISNTDGTYTAWSLTKKLGEFADDGEAAAAVLRAETTRTVLSTRK
jgi:hypothetical protein